MENNVVVKGKKMLNFIGLAILALGVILIIVSIFVGIYTWDNGSVYESGYTVIDYRVVHGYTRYYWQTYDSFISFFIGEFLFEAYSYIFLVGIVGVIVGLIIELITEKCEITVTTDGVEGKLSRGRPIEIPLNQITGIHKCAFWGVSVTAIAGTSKFYLIKNRDEILSTLAQMMASTNPASAQGAENAAPQNNGSTDADSLKDLKDLLDSGVITQEEFDEKKKQILGI